MNIVITMAGLGKRFRDAGYNEPKYMIKAKGKTLFEWSMESLKGFNDEKTKYIFIVRKEDDSSQFIKEQSIKLGINNFDIVELNELTDGQATTAMHASKYWTKEEPLLIYNIDTYVEAYAMNKNQLQGDGFIPCFQAEGDHWSFVKLDDNGNVVEIREKQRISDNCTLGAYYFATCALYEQLYNEYYKENQHMEKGEKYIAPLYNYLLEKGGIVKINIIDRNKVHVLGTPEELQQFINN